MDATHESTAEVSAVEPQQRPNGLLLQRKCACGASSGLAGACDECQQQRLTVQPYSKERKTLGRSLTSLDRSLRSNLALDGQTARVGGLSRNFGRIESRVPRSVQTKLAISQPGDPAEQEAERVAKQVTGLSLSEEWSHRVPSFHVEPQIQRAPQTTPAQEAAGPTTGALIVEDDAPAVSPGQMRKSQFLRLLHAEVFSVADAILPTVGRSANSCPYITNWIGYGYTRDSSYVETFVRRFTQGAESATTAQDYVSLVGTRLRQALLVWVDTGEITGVPSDLTSQLAATANRSAVDRVGAQIAPEGAVASAETASTSAQLKARDGGQASEVNPQAIQGQLGAGDSLDSSVKSRMEKAFGYNFSRVRVHHNSNAAHLSTKLNARAFTVGNDVAFGAGEYQPGTPIGDALLAHELAHVVQQGGADSFAAMQPGSAGYSALEQDADSAAVGAVISMWGGAKGELKDRAQQSMPLLRSGLRLSRCSSCKDTDQAPAPTQQTPQQPTATVPAAPPGEGWVRNSTAAGQTFGVGDMEGTYYIDASTTALAQQLPPRGNPAINQPNFVGAYFTFNDRSRANTCSSGNGERSWLSYKYYEENTVVGTQAPGTTGQWTPDISNFATNSTNFMDFAGLLVPRAGVSGYVRRSYRVGIICRCTSDQRRYVRGFLTDYSYNLDIWFRDSDVAVRVTPGTSYGGNFDWCNIPPPGITCVDSCAAATAPAAPTTPRPAGSR